MLAEVHRLKGLDISFQAPGATELADEAASAPGSAGLFLLGHSGSGEGYSIHLWRDRASYEAWHQRRAEAIAEAESHGGAIADAELYDVIYPSA